MKIIITDLTRFKNQDKVCTAGVAKDGTVIRPMPYLSADKCRELDIHPGGILEGKFTLRNNPAPHLEDANYSKLTFKGACSKAEFRSALEKTLYESMSEGFGVEVRSKDKCLPAENLPIRSLITIKVSPSTFSVVQNQFNRSQMKAHLSDGGGVELSFVSVTDRGFYDYAIQHKDDSREFAKINQFIQRQEELYLRIGLSREFKADDGRNGYWIQLNGIYTFPDKLDYIRCYE